MTTEQIWTVTVEQDPDSDDLILPLPPDLLAQAGWQEGDTLEWVKLPDGGWQLKKTEAAHV